MVRQGRVHYLLPAGAAHRAGRAAGGAGWRIGIGPPR
jgi:hypothetical protein